MVAGLAQKSASQRAFAGSEVPKWGVFRAFSVDSVGAGELYSWVLYQRKTATINLPATGET
jgi:hypothetical protein